MPCLAQVALAFLGCKPSAGHLECDFGSLNDILAPKRSSLSQGLVEIEMMLKLNKHLLLSQPEAVVRLPNSEWESHIPNRPRAEKDEDDDGGSEDEEEREVSVVDVEEMKESQEVSSVNRHGMTDNALPSDDDSSSYDSTDSMQVPETMDAWKEPESQTSVIPVCDMRETCDVYYSSSWYYVWYICFDRSL